MHEWIIPGGINGTSLASVSSETSITSDNNVVRCIQAWHIKDKSLYRDIRQCRVLEATNSLLTLAARWFLGVLITLIAVRRHGAGQGCDTGNEARLYKQFSFDKMTQFLTPLFEANDLARHEFRQ